MEKDDIYFDVLDYMCENFDYSLYAADFDTKLISDLKNSLTAKSEISEETFMVGIKVGLQDFFSAIFQKVSVYEEDGNIKIVKYFDKGAKNEKQDKQIHILRQNLVMHKENIESTLSKGTLYIFDKSSRGEYETTLIAFNVFFLKDAIREQMSRIYNLKSRDIIVFLNEKIFLKKFNHKTGLHVDHQGQATILNDQRFVESLWKDITKKLNDSFRNNFQFLNYSRYEFYKKYPLKLFSIIKLVVKKSFGNIVKKDILNYSNIAFKMYLPNLLEEIADYVLNEISKGELEATHFFKMYSESMHTINEKNNVYYCENILLFLKKREYLNLKINHKNKEIKNIVEKIKINLDNIEKSENEMEHIKKRKSELILSIKKIEDELYIKKSQMRQNSFNLNRLESSKRELNEASKQIETRFRTRTKILTNSYKELARWKTKKSEKNILKEDLSKEFIVVKNEYAQICKILAIALSKE
ncbi:MAG: hypothetical protein JJV95_02140 [Sulfurospirillum sp.]|nr:hypothetical protein [Sulfurospirillum sp.]MBL0702772.1 hypothetical protein [Sulfurospirillum sp.]